MTATVKKIEPKVINYYGFEVEQYNGYTFGLEPIAQCVDDLHKIHKLHWEETEVLYLGRPMDLDYDMLFSMEANRQFVFFSIRDSDGAVVGNLGFYLALSSHFKGQLMAKEDFLFIQKEHRRGGLFRAFYKYAEECLIKLGVKLIGISDKSPCGGKSLKPMLSREGFKEVAIVYIKEVM